MEMFILSNFLFLFGKTFLKYVQSELEPQYLSFISVAREQYRMRMFQTNTEYITSPRNIVHISLFILK